MSRSEFRWNKKRKHYAYLFKDVKDFRKNILLHSDPSNKSGWNKEKQSEFNKKHIKLFKHPNKNKNKCEVWYVETRIYIDHKNVFDKRIYYWVWDKNDKRKIKRIKKRRRTR